MAGLLTAPTKRRANYRHALWPALRRLDGVRVVVSAAGSHAEAYGVGHRAPARVRISLSRAAELAEGGVPCDVCFTGEVAGGGDAAGADGPTA